MTSGSGLTPRRADAATAITHVAELISARFPWAPALNGSVADARLREDLNLDSLHLVELQVAIEDHFGVRFDPHDRRLLDAFTTVGSLGSYVRHLLERET